MAAGHLFHSEDLEPSWFHGNLLNKSKQGSDQVETRANNAIRGRHFAEHLPLVQLAWECLTIPSGRLTAMAPRHQLHPLQPLSKEEAKHLPTFFFETAELVTFFFLDVPSWLT